ncbi:MAG: hypothetical protein AAF513_11070 [Pseudomonadota bacterium]
MSQAQPVYQGSERRLGHPDRRRHSERRNEDRVSQDMMPRRNPDSPGRRASDHA